MGAGGITAFGVVVVGAACLLCGGPLPARRGPRGPRLRWCSDRCRNWARRYPGLPMAAARCAGCDEPLPSTRRGRKFCSRRCRTLAARKVPGVRQCVVCRRDYVKPWARQRTCGAASCRAELRRRTARGPGGVAAADIVRDALGRFTRAAPARVLLALQD